MVAAAANIGSSLSGIMKAVRASSLAQSQTIRSYAEENNSSVQKMMKDIYRVFSSNSRNNTNITSSLEETVAETQRQSAKIDGTNNLLQQTLSIQSTIASEMKSMNTGLRALASSLSNGGIGGIGSKIGTTGLKLAALAGLAGAAYVGNKMMGDGGGSGGDGPGGGEGGEGRGQGGAPVSGAGGKYNTAAAAELIRKAGGNDDEARILGAISQAESSGNPNAHNKKGEDSYGLWQINLKSDPSRLKRLGLSDPEQLKDPEINAKAALMLYRGQLGARGGYQHWTVYNNGAYKKFLQEGGGAQAQRQDQGGAPSLAPTPAGGRQQQNANPATASRSSRSDTPQAAAGPAQRQQTQSESVPDSTRAPGAGSNQGSQGQSRLGAYNLNPTFAGKIEKLISAAEQATGERVKINEGYRDPKRQAQLYANYTGNDVNWEGKVYHPVAPGKSNGIIAAPPGQSNHQKGMALDVNGGKARDWMAAHASEYGIEWGGNWRKKDPPHFQLPGGMDDQAEMQSSNSSKQMAQLQEQGGGGEISKAGIINQLAQIVGIPQDIFDGGGGGGGGSGSSEQQYTPQTQTAGYNSAIDGGMYGTNIYNPNAARFSWPNQVLAMFGGGMLRA